MFGRWDDAIVCLMVACVYTSVTAVDLRVWPESGSVWIRESRPLNLTCTFTGYHVRDVTWRVNGSEIKSERGAHVTKQRTWTYETSYVTVTYYKRNAEKSDAGNYSCHVEQRSQTIEVKVTKGRLRIRPDSDKIIIIASNPITLVCEFEGNDLLPVTWYKYGRVNIGFMTRGYVVKPSSASRRIIVSSEISERFAKKENSGEYTCTAGPYSRTVTMHVSEDPCYDALVSPLPDSAITASTYYEDTLYSDAPPRGRLNTVRKGDITQTSTGRRRILGGSWLAAVTDKRQWIQVAFPRLTIVTEVITQGRSSTDCCHQQQWVTEYKLLHSKDGHRWEKYKDVKTGETKIFEGNKDHDTKVTHRLPVPVVARYLRINPFAWSEKISLRLGAMGCTVPSYLKMVYPLMPLNYLRTKENFQITCAFEGPEPPMMRWLKDERDLHLDTTFMKVIETSYNADGVTVRETLMKSKMTFGDSGTYTCRDETSQLQRSVAIHAAELDMQPEVERLWVTSGHFINISCTYRGAGQDQIEWQIDGQSSDMSAFTANLRYENLADTFSVISDVSKLATIADTADISCSVASLRRSISARVIPDKNKSVVLKDRETTIMDCSDLVHVDDVKYDVFWTKEHVPLDRLPELSGRYSLNSEMSRLMITNSKLSDAGRYECNVLLEVGGPNQRQVTITTDVNVAPVITMDGESSVLAGSTIHIFCHVTGYPVPKITWYKDDGPMPADHRYVFHSYEGIDTGHLEVHDVIIEDSGRYECRGREGVFPAVKKRLNIKVTEERSEGRVILIVGVLSIFASIVLIICCVAGFFRVARRRRRRKETRKALEDMLPCRDPFTKQYVQLLNTIDRKSTEIVDDDTRFISGPFDLRTTEERINLARSLPELPDVASLPLPPPPLDNETSSETYEKYERPMHVHTFPTEPGRSVDL